MRILSAVGLCLIWQMLFAVGGELTEPTTGHPVEVSIQNTPFEIPAAKSAVDHSAKSVPAPENICAGKDIFAPAERPETDAGTAKFFASAGDKETAGEDRIFDHTGDKSANETAGEALGTGPRDAAAGAGPQRFFTPEGAPGAPVNVETFARKADAEANRPPCTPEEYKSLELCTLRNALDIYYMDFAAVLRDGRKQERRDLHRSDMPPVQIHQVDRSWCRYGLLTAIGTLDVKHIPPRLRRTDLEFDGTITRFVCIAMRNTTSARAKLVRQAELKGFLLMLQRCAGKLDLATNEGRSAALRILAALNFDRCSFYEAPHGRELQIKVRMRIPPESLPAKLRNELGTELLQPLEFIESVKPE